MNRYIFKDIAIAITGLLLGACGNKGVTEFHETNRDNIIDGTSLIVAIDDNLPPINSFAIPIMAGDTLIIQDYRATDLVYTAYDVNKDRTIGRFGKYGAGPGEVGNPLFSFYNKHGKTLYVGNGTRGKLSSFHLPEAVADSTCDAVDRLPIDFTQGILYPYALDESTVLCTTYSDLSSRVSNLSTFNLDTGEFALVDSVALGERIGIAVSEKDNLIFAVDKLHDIIRILDLHGNARRIVYGPDYDENVEKNDYFFSESEICGDKVASIYTGRNSEKYRNTIILTDLDGNYIKTLHFDDTVHGMQYHGKTGRLYLTTTGEPQIGYIELDKIPD